MPSRDYSVPPVPSLAARPKERSRYRPSRLSARRTIQFQDQTDLYDHLDLIPGHKAQHCSTAFELEDRSKPSIASF